MRQLLIASLLLLTAAACQTTAPIAPEDSEATASDASITPDEEAMVLRMEDRREYDLSKASEWTASPSYLHRARMALALGRIGPHTFVDRNGDGVKSPGEVMAGVELLSSMRNDPHSQVRLNAAFSLGEIGDSAGLPALLEIARDDEHAGVRAEAIEALSKLAEHVPLADYLVFTGAGEPLGTRTTAIRFLFRFEIEEALAAAHSHLEEESSDVRRAAAYSLSRAAHAPAHESLIKLLGDEDVLTRSYASRALDRIASPRSLDPLLQSVLDIHPWVRINSLRGIASIATAHPAEFRQWLSHEKLVPVLATSNDPDPGTKATALETLAVFAPHLDAAKERLIDAAADDEPAFRESAARALLRAFPDEQSLHDAILETDSRWIRMIALQELSASAAGPSLRARYANDPDPSVRAAAVATIPDENVEDEKSLILQSLNDNDPIVRASAIGRAGELASEDRRLIALQQEERARKDELNDARVAAISMLAEVSEDDSLELFRGLLRDRDSVVRRIAADAIESFGLERPQYTPLETGRDDDWYVEVAWWATEPHSAVIETVRGPIEILLLAQDAPITAVNFADLAEAGYYDGTSFMRVVPNFVIQGGDPRNDMSGGPGYSIRDEINLQKYTRGAVGMALSGPDTGGSQFFITHSPQHHLDGGYTIFGRVTDGMTDTVDQIRRGDAVKTIRIDAATHTDQKSADKSARNPLPIEIGNIAPERTLTAIPEYRERMESYEPDETVISMMAPLVSVEDRIEVFLGTWCEDSQREMPRFYKIMNQLEQQNVTIPIKYVAVDRSKQEPSRLIGDRVIQLVPTFIVFRGDEEIGRIVEKPLSLLEDDLLRIFASAGR